MENKKVNIDSLATFIKASRINIGRSGADWTFVRPEDARSLIQMAASGTDQQREDAAALATRSRVTERARRRAAAVCGGR